MYTHQRSVELVNVVAGVDDDPTESERRQHFDEVLDELRSEAGEFGRLHGVTKEWNKNGETEGLQQYRARCGEVGEHVPCAETSCTRFSSPLRPKTRLGTFRRFLSFSILFSKVQHLTYCDEFDFGDGVGDRAPTKRPTMSAGLKQADASEETRRSLTSTAGRRDLR